MRKRPACQRELNPWSSLWSLSEPFAKPASVKCRGLPFIVHTHEEFKHEGMAVGACALLSVVQKSIGMYLQNLAKRQ